MNQSAQATIDKNSNEATSLKIAIVSSCWHKPIVDNAVQSARTHLIENGVDGSYIECFELPGAFELPLYAMKLAKSGRYDAVIACGFVVDGGIYRHEYVASAVINGLMQAQLESGVPVFSAVLTPHNFQESQEHIDFFAQHFLMKGTEVARSCLSTIESLKKLS